MKKYQTANGETITTSCHDSIFRSPAPTISWKKVGGTMSRSMKKRGSGLISIPIRTLADAGTYRCTASNIHGSKSTDTLVELECEWLSVVTGINSAVFKLPLVRLPFKI